ncbi:unnamed protein product (macronuclear) [Paramecium tetraurelia]|uniref:Uncharacterized protein n=1 Tax=Paramecium tetraurelia TaxID=5888 RepID=A0C077_PARTE|nr:uncharacterized protein GSPATT00006047001 [Paramecium tetraurelia]CAK64194.1 unnamed protein product [Paramecium tetraurelia]|eukprot:XP_001431592.1 hypothetical protein (macronuclear) [Paramecium tetraurelia strain d4-2]
MINQECDTKIKQQAIKSALKKELHVEDQMFRRYDRKGRQIAFGSKYEVTIDEHVQFLQAIPPASTPRDRTKSPIGMPLSARSPRSKSPLMDKAETATPIQNSQKKLEFTKKEEESLKILELKYQKQKKLSKQPKQCCIIW